VANLTDSSHYKATKFRIHGTMLRVVVLFEPKVILQSQFRGALM